MWCCADGIVAGRASTCQPTLPHAHVCCLFAVVALLVVSLLVVVVLEGDVYPPVHANHRPGPTRPEAIIELVYRCMDENPAARPRIGQVYQELLEHINMTTVV